MKLAMILPMIALCLFTATAQNVPIVGPKVSWGVQGDLGFVTLPGPEINGSKPLEEVYGIGYGGGVHLDIELVSISFRISGDYTTYSPDKEALASLGSNLTVNGGTLNIISLNANGKLPILPLPIVSPYLTGGIGLAKINADALEISSPGFPTSSYSGFDTGTSASANLGIGVDFDLFLSLFVEAKYIWIFDEGEASRYLPISLGVNF